MCLHDDFQGLGDKENMYGVGLFYHINSVNGWYRAMPISIKSFMLKNIYLINFSNFDLN